jgi:hypothetical protein
VDFSRRVLPGEFHFPNCSMVIFTTTEIKWKKKFSNLKQLYKY